MELLLSFYVTLDKRKDKSSHTVPPRCNLNPMQPISSFLPFPPVTTLRSPISQPTLSDRRSGVPSIELHSIRHCLLVSVGHLTISERQPQQLPHRLRFFHVFSSRLTSLGRRRVRNCFTPQSRDHSNKAPAINYDRSFPRVSCRNVYLMIHSNCMHPTCNDTTTIEIPPDNGAAQIVSIGNDSLITAPEEPAQFFEKPSPFCTSFSKQPSPNLSQHMELHHDSSFANPPENRE